MASRERLPQLGTAKGIAIIAVLAAQSASSALPAMQDSGFYAVYNLINVMLGAGTPLLLTLLGFSLFYTYYEAPFNREQVVQYYKQCLKYLFLPYALFSFIYFIMSHVLFYREQSPIAFIEGYWRVMVAGNGYSHLHPFWVGLQFALLFPAFLWVMKRKEAVARWAVPIGLAIQWAYFLLRSYVLDMPGQGAWLPGYMSCLLLGAYAGIYYPKLAGWLMHRQGDVTRVRIAQWTAIWITGIGAGLLHVYLWHAARVQGVYYHELLFEAAWQAHTITASIIVFQLAHGLHRRAWHKPVALLRRLGHFALGIYLFHPLPLFIYKHFPPETSNSKLVHLWHGGGFLFMLLASWGMVSMLARILPWSWMVFGKLFPDEKREGTGRVAAIVIGIALIAFPAMAGGLATIQPRPDSFLVTMNGRILDASAQGIRLLHGELMAIPAFIESAFSADVNIGMRHVTSDGVYYTDRVAILMYHEIQDEPEADHILSTEAFRQQMGLLREYGFHVISMEDYIRFKEEGAPVPPNAVLITFDDGYESFYSKAYPILQDYGYTATNFVIVSLISKANEKLPRLSWDQMREMKAAGMSFYSHTYHSHYYAEVNAAGERQPVLANPLYRVREGQLETDEAYMERITQDLSLAEQRLKEELGNERSLLAYPYGAYNEHVLEVIGKLDIQHTFTVRHGLTARADANAYRFDCGNSTDSPEEVMRRLIGAGGKVSLSHDIDYIMNIDGQSMPKEWGWAVTGEGEIWLPLTKVAALYGTEVRWNAKRNSVELIR
ncbi:polysaccharide deacetylase family protein [Paenibacillus sp. J5C_2022]|uniref:polysaccharide deacetylase family protein n=1 Tax=Paenibacillus sp. J5C2022 TaxID=2977129 RepID=UPI0021D3E9BE|nr:polysaccharide deacetylase family protein [Paenibacillus sp. J5C2022]MCU6708613.1 polysaccharide deacetylase family protein [Paenibacillus sp. J5C2022]